MSNLPFNQLQQRTDIYTLLPPFTISLSHYFTISLFHYLCPPDLAPKVALEVVKQALDPSQPSPIAL